MWSIPWKNLVAIAKEGNPPPDWMVKKFREGRYNSCLVMASRRLALLEEVAECLKAMPNKTDVHFMLWLRRRETALRALEGKEEGDGS